MGAVEFRILGPLEVVRDGRTISLSSAKQRLLLALLVSHANDVLSVDALVEGLWSDRAPATAVAVVQSYVSQLRKALEAPSRGASKPTVLLRAEAGYRLFVDPDLFDATQFERLSSAGRAALQEARPAEAIELLGTGLALWRGVAFGELAHEAAIQPAAQRLQELHVLALELRADAAVALGRHGEFVGELEALVAEHPLRERLWGQLMVCLYRSGRQAEALGAYQRLRRHLSEELGLEPSVELRHLESEILQHAPELDWFPTAAPSPPSSLPVVLSPAAGQGLSSAPPPQPMVHPAGTVTFLFTDIEGSTRRWEADPIAMGDALAVHDAVLRSAIELHGGWCFKHTGDGVCAAFSSALAAVDAAMDAQERLSLPVRMGIVTGEAERRGEDYLGPTLNRASRIMSAGHGGQILLSDSTAALLQDVELIDLGQHRLRGVTKPARLFQVRGDGPVGMFPPLRTIDQLPGNLPVVSGDLIGRHHHIGEVTGLVSTHRLVTLTGTGGVGKTSLALHAAAQLADKFLDGIWLVELAATNDPAAVPDLVAAALGVTAQPQRRVTDSIADSLLGRRVLIVLDNCEHVLDATAELAETLLSRTTTASLLATSREGLRLPTEQLWPVPPLDVSAGVNSPAVELFIQRATAVLPEFNIERTPDADAVTDICQQLDGIALAIELAAARMVSLSAQDIRDHLGDRFRLLAAPRRGAPRHQTLRDVVQWSFDLLNTDETAVLTRAAVFSDGFDLDAATQVCGQPVPGGRYAATGIDEFSMLDLLESLVRKSLITVDRTASSIRYGMLETIRQFGEGSLIAEGQIDEISRRHAAYLANQAVAWYSIRDGPGFQSGLDWLEPNMANLRAGFRWAVSHGEIVIATAIAAHTAIQLFSRQVTEPISWAEELLPAATAANVAQLPRLLVAASLCTYTGRAQDGVMYSAKAMELETQPGYEPYEFGMSTIAHANAQLFCGRPERWLELCADLAQRDGLARRIGLAGLLNGLPGLGRGEEARALADEALQAVRAQGNPFWVAFTLLGYGRAFADTDPQSALHVLREGVGYTRARRMLFWEAVLTRESASIEAMYGDLDRALDLFDVAIASQHQANNVAHTAAALASLAVCFDRLDSHETAAIIYGASTVYGSANRVKGLRHACEHLAESLGPSRFEQCVAQGAAMTLTDAVRFARQHISRQRSDRRHGSGAQTVGQ